MTKDYKQDNIWECSSCGIIVKHIKKPSECSCGNNDKFFLNTQIIKLVQRDRAKLIDNFDRKLFNNKNWSNRTQHWMINIGTWQEFKYEVLK